MKALLITVSTLMLLLFTSCEKDEMAGNIGDDGKGTTSTGGKEQSINSIPQYNIVTTTKEDTPTDKMDSLLHSTNKPISPAD